jgi:RNA polymerase sigma-70 factor (ECF subfamily)
LKTQRSHEEFSIDDPVLPDTNRGKKEPVSGEPTVLEKLETQELQRSVQGCIDQLFSELKEVLVLRDIHSFSYEEIRDILQIPDGTVKSRLFRARDAVKGCLKKVIGDL